MEEGKKPPVFTKKIGKMKYIVNVHFKEDGKEDLNWQNQANVKR